MSIYEPVVKRLKELNDHTSPSYVGNAENPFSSDIALEHGDGSKFLWKGCYYEFMEVILPPKRENCNLSEYEIDATMVETEWCVIIVPEHHAPFWYCLEDLEVLEEVTVEFKEVRKDLKPGSGAE